MSSERQKFDAVYDFSCWVRSVEGVRSRSDLFAQIANQWQDSRSRCLWLFDRRSIISLTLTA